MTSHARCPAQLQQWQVQQVCSGHSCHQQSKQIRQARRYATIAKAAPSTAPAHQQQQQQQQTSLIPETLQDMQSDEEFQQTAARLAKLGQAAMTREEKHKRQRSLDSLGVPSFGAMLKVSVLSTFLNTGTQVHVPIGLRCVACAICCTWDAIRGLLGQAGLVCFST